MTLWPCEISFVAQNQEKIGTFLVSQKGLTKYINGPKCLRLSQHYLGLHIAQLVFHFCLYIPCDTKCRTFLRMAQYYIYKESRIFSNIVILLFFVHQNYQRNRKFLLFLPVKEMFEKSIKQIWLFRYLPRSLPSYFKYNRYCSFVLVPFFFLCSF